MDPPPRLVVLYCILHRTLTQTLPNRSTERRVAATGHGHYYDAIHVKGNRVIPFITSPSGGIAPHGLAHLKMLARASRLPGGRDGTRYGLSRLSPRSFFTHHLQRISAALVRTNARDVFDLITGLKQRAAAMDA